MFFNLPVFIFLVLLPYLVVFFIDLGFKFLGQTFAITDVWVSGTVMTLSYVVTSFKIGLMLFHPDTKMDIFTLTLKESSDVGKLSNI